MDCPANITQLIIEGCGGGGGGGGGGGSGSRSGFYSSESKYNAPKPGLGGGSGGSSYFTSKRISVTPGQNLVIVVGAGGALVELAEAIRNSRSWK